MGKIKYESTGTKNPLSIKGPLITICVCVLALGGIAWAAIAGSGSNPAVTDEPGTQINSMPESSDISDAAGIVGGIPENRPDTEEIEAEEPAVEAVVPAATYFTLPATGEIIKEWNDSELQYSETFLDMRIHTGADIAADLGSAVMACGEGVVTESGSDAMWGNYVVIDHGNGVTARYCGLDSVSVSKDAVVNNSTTLGTVGSIPCEGVERPHVHLEMAVDGVSVNPLMLMGME